MRPDGAVRLLAALQVCFAGMMQYDGELKLPKYYLVPPPSISHTTGEYLAKSGVSTYACSESQKIGHVTFFWCSPLPLESPASQSCAWAQLHPWHAGSCLQEALLCLMAAWHEA